MKAFIVNLAKDKERKNYMSRLVASYPFLDTEFIEAVYGKALSEEELNQLFDLPLTFKRYGRQLNPGEIGCTLSHFKCYRHLLEGSDPYVLLLEDDITVLNDFSIVEKIAASLPEDEPWVLFLSGDYWYTSKRRFEADVCLAKVYDAVGTYAYAINRKGAELILQQNSKASCVADNWSLYRSQGLKLYAVNPYLIDANIETFDSSIEQTYFGEVRKNMPWTMRIKAYKLSLVKRILLKTGRFVSKIRK